MIPVSAAAREHAADVVRHILEVPLVDKTVDLTGLLVALVGGIGIVYDADKSDAPDGEQAVYVLFDQLKLAGKAGLRLAQHDVEFMRLGIRQKAVEFRTAAVGAGIVIVAVYMIDLPALPGGVLHQHRLLVPDAAGVIGFALLISVLLGQAAVNSCFHARISFQEIEQAISAIIIP